jgi:putative restriction endonuclease
MVLRLSLNQLLQSVLRAVDESGWQAIVVEQRKPFRLHLFRDETKGFNISIYIWNCTHGGGAARATDEYRVQLTGVVPRSVPGELTLLLGWHPGYEVFVGFDITKHEGQASQSPSIQVKEQTLQNAHLHAFAVYPRQTGEIAVAFRPEFLVEYAINLTSLHETGRAVSDMALLNSLDTLTDTQIETVQNQQRQVVLTQIARKYRAADFRRRVLGAYGHRCAACNVQLELVDAAHIIPVAAPSSTDETRNGIALCKLHHAAFDRNLFSFDEGYKIEVSSVEVDRLSQKNLAAGLARFRQSLRTAVALPSDRRDYPPREYISLSRNIRNWERR